MLGRKMPLFGTATADLWILLFYTSVFFRVTAAVAADFNLQPRKNVDHNLDCRRSPLPSAESWPPLGAPRSSFQNLTQLCGRVADRRTVGCLCDKPYTGVKCPNTGAISVVTDQALWRSYQSYCEGYCRCATLPNRDWSIFDEGIIRDAADASAARQRMYDTPSLPGAILGIPSPVTTRSLDATQEGICGGSCTTITQQCSSGSTGQCKCTAQPIGGERGSIVQFSGSCATVHIEPKSIDRIEDDKVHDGSSTSVMVADDTTGFFAANGDRIACPCNATYVSYGCCGSGTGIVWETPDQKLGELRVNV